MNEAAANTAALGPAPGLSMGRAARLASYLIPGLVALITFVVFSPALRNGFVNWDDLETLVENQNFRGLTWSHLRWMFTTFHMGHYQPLSWVTFSLDYLLWGMDPFGYHLTNILLHSANAVLFLFRYPVSAGDCDANFQRRCADAGCGIFRAALCHSSAAG